jgi:hypothetical protein
MLGSSRISPIQILLSQGLCSDLRRTITVAREKKEKF